MRTLFALLLVALPSLAGAQITEDSLRTLTKTTLDSLLTDLKDAPLDTVVLTSGDTTDADHALRAERARRKVVKDTLGLTVVKSPSHPQGGILRFAYPMNSRTKQRRVEEAVIVAVRDCRMEPVTNDSLWTWALYGHREKVKMLFERLRDTPLAPDDTLGWVEEDSTDVKRWRKLLHNKVDAGRF